MAKMIETLQTRRPGTLYLLVDLPGEAFKIGIACNTYRRAAELPVQIAFSCSYEVPVPEGDARAVERLLHYLFRDCQVAKPQGDGHTEWFAISALPQVLTFLAQHRSSLGIGLPMPLQSPRRIAPEPSARVPARQRTCPTPAVVAQAQARAAGHNRKLVADLRAIIGDLRASGALVGVVTRHKSRGGCIVLQGPARNEGAERIRHLLPAPGVIGGIVVWHIFSSMLASPLSRVDVVQELISDDPISKRHKYLYPCIDEVRLFLLSCLPNADAEDRRLQGICHHLDRKCAMTFGRLSSAA